MSLKNEFKFLVIIGAWNNNIFTEQWVKKYLIPDNEFKVEMAFGTVPSHRISTDKFRIEFEPGRISLIPIKFDFELCETLIDIAVKLADYLPHTPITGYGINLVFVFKSQDVENSLIKICDKESFLGYSGINYIESQYQHKFKFDEFENYTVNLAVKPSEETCTFDFNFHSEAKDLVEFKGSIYDFDTPKLYKLSMDLLTTVYEV
ncbi:MAG: hypothetical protein R6V54_00315 [Desulfobacteraceae bacterium]